MSTAYTAGRVWDKLKLLVCQLYSSKAVSFAVFTTVVVGFDMMLVLAFTKVISSWFLVVTLPAIGVNYWYLAYLWHKAKSLRAAQAATSQASHGGGGQNPA